MTKEEVARELIAACKRICTDVDDEFMDELIFKLFVYYCNSGRFGELSDESRRIIIVRLAKKRMLIDKIRQKGRRGTHEGHDALLKVAAGSVSALEEVIMKETEEQLEHGISMLTPKKRQIVDDIYEGKSASQVAEEEGNSRQAVHKKRREVVKDLSKFLT